MSALLHRTSTAKRRSGKATDLQELGTMPPNILRVLVREHGEPHADPTRLRVLKLGEREEREGIAKLAESWGGAG